MLHSAETILAKMQKNVQLFPIGLFLSRYVLKSASGSRSAKRRKTAFILLR
jgi:hypothetical protein